MMCSCEEEFAKQYFSHQINTATTLKTQERIPVTLGFQKDICNTCKGISEEAHPTAVIYGRTTKIKRYYWREIQFETTKRFGEWAKKNEYSDWLKASIENREKYEEIEKQVIKEIKNQHAVAPKYTFSKDITLDEIKDNYGVNIIDIHATYIKSDDRKTKVLYNETVCTVEEYTRLYFQEKGYQVLKTESIPFHVIFGTYMWIFIQDPQDIKCRLIRFGDRIAYDKKEKGIEIQTILPEDFGTIGYYERRKVDIIKHINNIAKDELDLMRLFEYWINHSFELRNYLWAHKEDDINKAKILISKLGLEVVKKILHYLVKNYWDRYLGWPDLFVYNDNEYFFIEVKSSNDKLSDNQKNWIQGNYEELMLPFKLFKFHKKL